jgi:hypothetical protein
MNPDLIDILMSIHHRTDKAVLASDDGDRDNAVWLPLAQIEIEPKGQWFEITMPQWLAEAKELN